MRPPEEAQFNDLFGPPIKTTDSPKKVKPPAPPVKVNVKLFLKLVAYLVILHAFVVVCYLFVSKIIFRSPEAKAHG